MKSNLKFSKLGEVSEIFAGGDKPSNFSLVKDKGHQVPVFANGETNLGLQGFTDKAKVNRSAVTVSARGTIGYAVLREEPFVPIVRLLTLIPDENKLDVRYLYYYLTLYRQAGLGSSQPQLTVPDIANRKISMQSLSSQQAIGRTLSILDKKIELNNKINAELEYMAKTIYDYWFVQFDFPNADGEPYKSSGGAMVYSEELKREIPKGWTIKQLDDIISRSGTGLNPRDNFKLGHGDNFYITIKNVKNGKIIFDDTCDKVDDEALKIINRRSDLQVGDVLFTSIEPVGVTYFIHEKPRNWNINESVFTIRANYERVTSEYLYMLLSGSEMKAFTSNASAGSIHKGIRHNVLKIFKLPYKDKCITEHFSEIVKPILRRIYILDNENHKLTELRDWLLPMLMNGQVTVAD